MLLDFARSRSLSITPRTDKLISLRAGAPQERVELLGPQPQRGGTEREGNGEQDEPQHGMGG